MTTSTSTSTSTFTTRHVRAKPVDHPAPVDVFKDADTGLPLFNMYRKGLQLFVLHTRDGHPRGIIWAGSSEAATGRANSIIGSGAFVARANGSK